MPETPKDIWFEPYRRPYTDRAGDLVASVVEQVTSYEVAKKLQKRCGKTGARTLQLGLDCLHLTLDARSNGRQLMKCCAFRKFPAFSQKQRLFETTMDKEILTVREVAAYLKIKEKTAYRLAAEGKIPGFKVGGSWRFRQQDIESWIEAQSAGIESDKKRKTRD